VSCGPTSGVSSSPRSSSLPLSKARRLSTTRSFEPISIATSTRTLRLAAGLTEDRGLIDTSVAVDIRNLDAAMFPPEVAISALTLGELATGPRAASDELTRARRQSHLQFIEANLEALPFESSCARAYGIVYAAVDNAGRKPRGRAVDLMIAATALAHELPLYTRNAKDLHGLGGLLEIVDVSA
jgi:predicted nucleic acid-binding protein